MNADQIIQGLRELEASFGSILEDDAAGIIEEAIVGLGITKRKADERKGKSHHPRMKNPLRWGYQIAQERPLRFKTSTAVSGMRLWVDICCSMLWEGEDDRPKEQDILMRVWTDSEDYQYRSDWDSHIVLDQLNNPERYNQGRVMLRCHFDLANENQQGPGYHLQFGGNAPAYELCWFPEIIKIPRFAYPPMDLILVCQLVAANFFWDEYVQIRESPEWTHTIHHSQEYLFRDYYRQCADMLDNDQALLDRLWNVSGGEKW